MISAHIDLCASTILRGASALCLEHWLTFCFGALCFGFVSMGFDVVVEMSIAILAQDFVLSLKWCEFSFPARRPLFGGVASLGFICGLFCVLIKCGSLALRLRRVWVFQ